MNMKIELDLHTHTVLSGHAYSTVQEMAAEASRRGIKWLGITDHGPAIPGACHPIAFRNLYVIPKQMYGVNLMLGAELNIVDYDGRLDLDESYYDRLSHVVAGLHRLCYTAGTLTQNTDAVLGAMHNPRVNIISHPADGTATLDLEAIVRHSVATRTLLEVNNSSIRPDRGNKVARGLHAELLRLCRKHDVPVILGSDAHIAFSIADYTYLYPLLQETNFPAELVVNDDMRKFVDFCGLNPAFFATFACK